MAASAIKAGEAFVQVFADLNPLKRGIGQVQGIVGKITAPVGRLGVSTAKIAAGISAIGAGIITPIALAAKSFADFGSEIDDASQRSGIGAEAMSELGYAAKLSGTDMSTVEKASSKLQKNVAAAAMGNKAMAESFDAIGLSARKLESMGPEQQFMEVAKAVGAIKNPTIQTYRALQIFGKGGHRTVAAAKVGYSIAAR